MNPPAQPPRLVIDTNVVLSALVFPGGRPGTLRHAWQEENCRPLVSQPTAAELIRVLAYPKFKLLAGEQRELLADYLSYCETVALPAILPETDRRAPFDLPFLHLAIVGHADTLVSGDQDLLSLKAGFACPILSVEEWLSTLADHLPLPSTGL
jgi:putative PIN family toxin of toxin-antitoxin system